VEGDHRDVIDSRALFSGLLLLLSSSAWCQQQQSGALCDMTKEQANLSPLCVRWYFACELKLGKKPTTGPYAALDEPTRQRLLVGLTLRLAELSCRDFSYQEALAAAQSHLIISETPTARRPP